MSNHFWRFICCVMLLLGGWVVARPAPGVQAGGSIVVNTPEDVVDPAGDTGLCSLRQAVRAANLQMPVGACVGVTPGGPTTIHLPAGTYVLTRTTGMQAWMFGPLVITNSVALAGASASTLTGGPGWDRRLVVVGSETTAMPEAIVRMQNLTLQGGRDTTGGGGGGILVGRQSTLHADGLTLFDNLTTGAGGAVLNFGGRVTLTRTTIISNSAGFGGGGGVYNASPLSFIGVMTLTQSSVVSNSLTLAEQFGGGVFNDTAVLVVRNTTISHNRATADGGGVFAQTGSNNTFNNVTIAYNLAGLDTTQPATITLGAGIRNFSVFRIANSVVAHNERVSVPANLADDCKGSPLTSAEYNLVQYPSAGCFTPGTNDLLTGTVPLLGALRLLSGQWAHWPEPASPLLLAGNPAPLTGYPNCEAVDQLGFSRAGRRCDIGAVRPLEFIFLPMVMR